MPEAMTMLGAPVTRVLAGRSTSLAPRIVILGGGFAGVSTALELAQRCAGVLPVHITLISNQNFFLFTPMLAEAATGAVEAHHVIYPIRPLLCGELGVEFGEMTVEAIDLERRRVTARHRRSPVRQEIQYDMLVLALGVAPNTAIAPGAEEHALPFKAVGDAFRIRNHVINQFEAAALTDDPWVRRRLLTFVVVGAGHAGTELMAAIEELTRGILLRHYPSIPRDAVRLVLVGSAVLPQTATQLAAYTKEQLLKRGIELETARAAKVSPEGLTLQDGRLIPSRSVIWTAGTRVSPLVANLPVPKTKDGRVKVNGCFEVEGFPGVYALGDNAAQVDPHTGETYVATAQVAVRQGPVLAAVIEAELTGRPKRPFAFRLLGEMVPLSRRTAVADLRGLKLVGFPAWFMWKTVYMLKLPTLAARLRVVLDWTVEIFFERDVSELALGERRGA
jgi:NADH dehydrogenase